MDREVVRALESAVKLARGGLVIEALAVCAHVLRKAPYHRAAWRMRAHLLARMGAWDEAIGSLSCIIDNRPGNNEPGLATDLLSRGRWRLEAGDIAAALDDLSALLAPGFDESAWPWRSLARLLRAVAGAQMGLHAGVLRDLAGLDAQAGIVIAGSRWQVREMRRDADSALYAMARRPVRR